jgi:enoyl-CoA hydratase/carnithine racemase
MGDVLLSHREKDVLTLTLNRPERKNALNGELWDRLREEFTAAGNDPGLRAVVITGAGDAFCAGADLSGGVAREHPLHRMRGVNEVALLLHELPMPSIAWVDGVAVGAGWNLALGCDLLVATPRSRFSQIFARRGLSVDFGGSWLLPRLVGLHQAKRLALLAEMIDAAEAYRLGLVTHLAEPDEIAGVVADLAGRLAAGPPVALAQSKALLNEGSDRTMRDALAAEARAQTINFATADAPAAFRAFNEKREPTFTGEWAVE